MIRELICYICTCSKCKHQWNTKSHDLPWNCSKCKSRLWNDDYEPESRITFKDSLIQKPTDRHIEPQSELQAFIAKAQAAKGIVQSEPINIEVTPNQWFNHTDELSTLDQDTGETVYYREHLKTRKRTEIRRETAW